MDWGKAIKVCRTYRGTTQEQLAAQAGISVSYLSMLENNRRDPTVSTLLSVSVALGLPLIILAFMAGENEWMSDELKAGILLEQSRVLGEEP